VDHPNPGGSFPLKKGLNLVRLAVPDLPAIQATLARFRFSSAGKLAPTGAAPDGEVEDHFIRLFPFPPDFGDAPDSLAFPGYPTLAAHNGALHLVTEEDFFLGAKLDFEPDATTDGMAFGDDGDDGVEVPFEINPDDEDGVTFLGVLRAGQTATVQVFATIKAAGPAKLDAWIDFNGDHDWADPGEQILTSANVTPGANAFPIPIPAGTPDGVTYARFRLSRSGNLQSTGAAMGGEVEDYAVDIEGVVASCRITSITLENGQVVVRWTGAGQLRRSTGLGGPWLPVIPQQNGIATISPTDQISFFRLACE
jgi:hypothetical protein